MRRLITTALVLALSALPLGARADDLATAPLFAGGGTNLTSGFFFPGTAIYNEDTKEWTVVGTPYQIEQGTDIQFVNTDPSPLTNAHQIQSLKRRKNGRPFFQSARVSGPGQAVMITSHLKPGLYYYRCTTHFGMFGALEVV